MKRRKALKHKKITGHRNLYEEDRHDLNFGCPNQGGCDGRGMLHIWGNGNIHEIYGWKTRREEPSLGSKIKLKQILTEI
jgi:hypothetical protein